MKAFAGKGTRAFGILREYPKDVRYVRTTAQVALMAMLALAILLIAGCPPRKFTGKDAEMMAAAKTVAKLIDEYFREGFEYPETFDELKVLLPPNKPWPVNPYNGKPLADTGSRDFDPETSVGMVYYERIFRDEQMVNYNLHVFGERGKLYIIGNTAIGVKE